MTSCFVYKVISDLESIDHIIFLVVMEFGCYNVLITLPLDLLKTQICIYGLNCSNWLNRRVICRDSSFPRHIDVCLRF